MWLVEAPRSIQSSTGRRGCLCIFLEARAFSFDSDQILTAEMNISPPTEGAPHLLVQAQCSRKRRAVPRDLLGTVSQ
jgi:hypothetical protein